MSKTSYITLHPIDTSFKPRGSPTEKLLVPTHRQRKNVFYSTHSAKPKKGAMCNTMSPADAHAEGKAVLFSVPNSLIYFHTQGLKFSIEQARFQKLLQGSASVLRLDIHDVVLYGTVQNRSKNSPTAFVMQLFGFVAAHVNPNKYITCENDLRLCPRSKPNPVYSSIVRQQPTTKIVCVEKTDYLQSLDGDGVLTCSSITEVCGAPASKRQKVDETVGLQLSLTGSDTAVGAGTVLAAMHATFETAARAGCLLTQTALNTQFPYLSKHAKLYEGNRVAVPYRYAEWLRSEEDTMDGAVLYALSPAVMAGAVPIDVTLRPEATYGRSHALQIRTPLSVCLADASERLDVVYPIHFGHVDGALPHAQHVDDDAFRVCFGGHVGTIETLAAARKTENHPSSGGVIFVYANRSPATEFVAALEWAIREYGCRRVFVQGSSAEAGPLAVHSSANIYLRNMRPPVPFPSSLCSDILLHIKPVERSVSEVAPYNTTNGTPDIFSIGGASHISYDAVSATTAVLGQIVLVKGGLHSVSLGGLASSSGYAPMRLKCIRDGFFVQGNRLSSQARPSTLPERLVGTFDPLLETLPVGQGISFGGAAGIEVKLQHSRVRMLHGADPTGYIGPTLAGIRLRFTDGPAPSAASVIRSIYTALGMATYVEAGKEDIERLLTYAT